MRIEELSMSLDNLLHRFFAPMLILVVTGGISVLAPQSASAQEITVTAPFPFSVNHQQYPAGTYQFSLLSEWLLSIHNADRKENFFPIRPERSEAPGSRGHLTFSQCEGHNELLAVYIPGTDMTAKLVGPKSAGNEMKLTSQDHR
jgi:hypothetical protein